MKSAISLLLVLLMAHTAGAECRGSFLNPVTDVCWDCMFPVRIGGVAQFGGGGGGTAPGAGLEPVCICPTGQGFTVGLTVGFWEHARLIEPVKEPYCFPVMGTGLSNPSPGYGSGNVQGTGRDDVNAELGFKQVHYYVFPVWALMNLFMDFPCTENDVPFDLAYMSELDILHSDDLLSFILNPEALAFGNPISQLACPVDTVASTVSEPIDALFWCAGAWGSMYPFTGNAATSNPLDVSALVATRLLFKQSREGILLDTAINKCSFRGVYTPIMFKSHYRFQIARPIKGDMCIPIGRPSMIWGSGKNPPWGSNKGSADNFLYIETRARVCCAGYSMSGNQ